MPKPVSPSISTQPPRTGPRGQLAHPLAIAHTQRLQHRLYAVGDQAWSLVGNGLSNQSFVEGPDGIIAIDSGESVEEMRAALVELRKVTTTPVVACIYTHFHYVNGTQAIFEEVGNSNVQIYGHGGIPGNLKRFGGEVAPRSNRGLVSQFGTKLPSEGADALLHCGLGLFYHNPAHSPYTPGYIPAQHNFDQPTTFSIAGLRVDMTPAPADATDSITIWFPELKLCINNLIWPALFNIYAIRGEEFRDPRGLLKGIDHIISLQPDHLIGTHGPPLDGLQLEAALTRYRDSIQFIWDQTIRGINQGLTLGELTRQVQLPGEFEDNYLTQQLYGLVEHHVRQIHSGLFGWFDEDESHLFPLPTPERCRRLIKGFGGRVKVRQQSRAALADGDYRWGIELATWLTRSPGCKPVDRQLLADHLRGVARHTPAANLRNWCLTRALELEGTLSLDRHRRHHFSVAQVMAAEPARFIGVLSVLLDPGKARGTTATLAWHFATGEKAALCIRNQVAVVCEPASTDLSISLSQETWAQILANQTSVSQCLNLGTISVEADTETRVEEDNGGTKPPPDPESRLLNFFAAFDHPGLR